MPVPDLPPEQRRHLLLLADEVAGWHAELGSARAQQVLADALTLLAHALVDLADGQPPQPRPSDTGDIPAPSRAAARSAGADRAACSALAARLRTLGREVPSRTPGPGADAVAESAAALSRALQEHAQQLAGSAHPSPSAVRWLAPRLEAAVEPVRRCGAPDGSRRDGARPPLR